MKLWDRCLVRSIRREVRRRIRVSPTLRRARREAPRGKPLPGWPIVRALISIGLVTLSCSALSCEIVLTVLASWSAVTMISRGARLQDAFIRQPVDPAFLLLPVPDEEVRKFRWQSILRGSWWSLADVTVVLGILSWKAQAGPWTAVVALLGLLMWAAPIGAIVVILRYLTRFPFAQLIAFGGFGGFVVLIFERNLSANAEFWSVLLPRIQWFVQYATPPGWVAQAVAAVLGTSAGVEFLWILPALALSAVLPWALDWLPQLRSIDDLDAESLRQEAVEISDLLATERQEEFREAEIENTGRIRELSWLHLPVPGDVVQKTFCRWLTSRQRTIFFLLFHERQARAWTHRLALSMKVVLIGLATSLGLSWWWSQGAGVVVLCATGVVAAITALPLLDGSVRAFQSLPVGLRLAQMHAVLPVAPFEIRQILLKMYCIRYLAAFPILLLYGAAGSFALGDAAYLVIVAKIFGAALALIPLRVIFQLTAGTNDTQMGCVAPFTIVFGGILTVGLLVMCLLVAFRAGEWWLVVLSLLGAFTVSWLAAWGYEKLYSRNNFDLMSAPPAGFGS